MSIGFPLAAPAAAAVPRRPELDARQAAKLHEAALAFEGLLVQTLLRSMQQAQLPEGLFGEGPGASLYQGLWEQHLSEALTRDSPFGIARQIEEHWLAQGLLPETDELRRAQAAMAYERAARFPGIPDLPP